MLETKIVIRRMRQGEEHGVCLLVREVFAQSVAPLYSQEGVEEFERYVEPKSMAKRAQSKHFVLVAEADGKLIGAIEVKGFSHISLLFVAQEWQRQGIGRKLLDEALEIAKRTEPESSQVDVHSSPNAVDAYKRFGFEAVAPEKLKHGIRFVPMRMRLGEVDDG